MDDMAFSVLDAENGKVLRSVVGPNPGKLARENIATYMAVSPDEHFVAVIYNHFTNKRVGIFSTRDWQIVASLDPRNNTDPGDIYFEPRGVVFSPDSETLAVLQGSEGQFQLFEARSGTFVRSIKTFPETVPPGNAIGFDALAFSPDGTLIAAASHGGGSWWVYPDGKPAPPGSGVLTQYFPAEPLRVLKLADGARVASLGSFPGGVDNTQLVWSPNGQYLAFIDGIGDIRFWDPFHPGASVIVASMGNHSRTLLFSKDGSQLVANFEGGVKVFDVANHH
jgi:WD40 repeat protein